MKITVFSFTHNGAALAASITKDLTQTHNLCQAYTMPKYAAEYGLLPIEDSVRELTGQFFSSGDALIYIGACGIAVRSIAPYVQDKTTDPCILSIDEKGQYVIPLLSGHIGKGNELALQIATMLGAVPVISTATDLNGRFAVDVFAARNNLKISDMRLAKKISAAILDGDKIGICGLPPQTRLPQELTTDPGHKLGICISPYTDRKPYAETLHLIPKQTVLGIGCRKGVPYPEMAAFVEHILQQEHIDPASLLAIASIELKKDEPCLTETAHRYQLPFVTYSADALSKVKGNLSSSDYVKKITGVDNVCERAALACSHADTLALKKTIDSGKTIAIAMAPLQIHF